jgi:hypothetical protein
MCTRGAVADWSRASEIADIAGLGRDAPTDARPAEQPEYEPDLFSKGRQLL